MLIQYKKTSGRFALTGGIIGGELDTNGRTRNARLLMKDQLAACCPKTRYSFVIIDNMQLLSIK